MEFENSKHSKTYPKAMQENQVFTSEIIRIENKPALVKAMGLIGRGGGKLLFSNRGDHENVTGSDKASKTVSDSRFITGNHLLWHNF